MGSDKMPPAVYDLDLDRLSGQAASYEYDHSVVVRDALTRRRHGFKCQAAALGHGQGHAKTIINPE